MNKKITKWLDKLLNKNKSNLSRKFIAGDKEHCSQFLNLSEEELINEALDEVLDLTIYLTRVKELVEKRRRS